MAKAKAKAVRKFELNTVAQDELSSFLSDFLAKHFAPPPKDDNPDEENAPPAEGEGEGEAPPPPEEEAPAPPADEGDGEEQKPKPQNNGKTIRNVEIFRTGEWNDESYSRDDLQEMVDSFDLVGFNVPVKLGHMSMDDAPAVGWVSNLRLEGDVLLADITDIPAEVYGQIVNRQYDQVSAEIFVNLTRGDEVFKRVLKAVALLGAETPAVAGLKPLREAMFKRNRATNYEKLVLCTNTMGAKRMAEKPKETPDALTMKRLEDQNTELKAMVHRMAEERRAEVILNKVKELRIPALRDTMAALYDLATRAEATEGLKVVKFALKQGEAPVDVSPVKVVDDLRERLNGNVAHIFKELSVSGKFSRDDGVAGDDPGIELDRKAKALVQEGKAKTYAEASKIVRRDPNNAELVRRYNAGES